MPEQLIFYSIDYDGCGARPEIQSWLMNLLSRDLLALPDAHFYLLTGSFRQYIDSDAYCWRRNSNGSCFIFLENFVEKLKGKFKKEAHRIHLETFLLQDLSENLVPGSTFEKALQLIRRYNSSSTLQPPTFYSDGKEPSRRHRLKTDLILAQVSHIYNKYGAKKSIHLSFIDDRSDIYQAIWDYYSNRHYLLSKNVHLRLININSKGMEYKDITGSSPSILPLSSDELLKFDQFFKKTFLLTRYVKQIAQSSAINCCELIENWLSISDEVTAFVWQLMAEMEWENILLFFEKNAKNDKFAPLFQKLLHHAVDYGYDDRVAVLLSSGMKQFLDAETKDSAFWIAIDKERAAEESGKKQYQIISKLFAQHAKSKEEIRLLYNVILTLLLNNQLSSPLINILLSEFNGVFSIHYIVSDEGSCFYKYSILHLAIHHHRADLIPLIFKKSHEACAQENGLIFAWELVCQQRESSLFLEIIPYLRDFVLGLQMAIKHDRDDICNAILNYFDHEMTAPPSVGMITDIKNLLSEHNKGAFLSRFYVIVRMFPSLPIGQTIRTGFIKLKKHPLVDIDFYSQFMDISRCAFQTSPMETKIHLLIAKVALIPVLHRFSYLYAAIFHELQSMQKLNEIFSVYVRGLINIRPFCIIPIEQYPWANRLLNEKLTECVTIYAENAKISSDCRSLIEKIKEHLSFYVESVCSTAEARDTAFHSLMLGIMHQGFITHPLKDEWENIPLPNNMNVHSVLRRSEEWSYTKYKFFKKGSVERDDRFIEGLLALLHK